MAQTLRTVFRRKFEGTFSNVLISGDYTFAKSDLSFNVNKVCVIKLTEADARSVKIVLKKVTSYIICMKHIVSKSHKIQSFQNYFPIQRGMAENTFCEFSRENTTLGGERLMLLNVDDER